MTGQGMRKTASIAVFFLAFATITASAAWAQSPHFIGTATVSAISSDGSISVSFKEAGVGNNVLISYAFGGNWVADYGCVNKGGNHPSASNKTAESGTLNVTGSFESGKNGSINGSLTFTPPSPDTELSCPGNQVAVLADISYTGLTLTDTTNNVAATLSTTQEAAIFFTF